MSEENKKGIITCPNCGEKLLADSIFCVKCGYSIGTKVEESSSTSSEKVNESESKKKKGTKGKTALLIILMIVVLILGVIGAFFYLLKTEYLYQNGYINKIHELTGICLQHHYKPADCIQPETCEICNATKGESLGHEWQEVTCEAPKTCSKCYDTEGEALGHTTRMGVCDNCGEKRCDLEKELLVILNHCQNGSEDSSSAVSFISGKSFSSVYSAYLSCSSTSTYFSYAKDDYQKAYDACGDFEEFIGLKTKLRYVINSLPTVKPSNSLGSCEDYLDKAKTCLIKQKELAEYQTKLFKEWGLTD